MTWFGQINFKCHDVVCVLCQETLDEDDICQADFHSLTYKYC